MAKRAGAVAAIVVDGAAIKGVVTALIVAAAGAQWISRRRCGGIEVTRQASTAIDFGDATITLVPRRHRAFAAGVAGKTVATVGCTPTFGGARVIDALQSTGAVRYTRAGGTDFAVVDRAADRA